MYRLFTCEHVQDKRLQTEKVTAEQLDESRAGEDLVIWGSETNSVMEPPLCFTFTLSLIEYVGIGGGRQST